MAKLSAKEMLESRGFLVDLFSVGGLIKPGDTSIGQNLANRWHNMHHCKGSVDTVCTEIVQRNFDFFNVDKAINELSGCKFFVDPTAFGRVRGARMVTRSAQQIAGFIAYFCKSNGIFWDDVNTNKTTYEMDQYRKTLLGEALWDYQCFLSQNSGNNASTSAGTGAATTSTATTATRTLRTPRVPGQAPKNDYKSQGPKSGLARDLKGQPGQKVQANTNVIFCIVGDNAKASSPAFALVKPLTKGAEVNGTNKVFISSSHGYADCTCYFDDLNDANAFLQKCIANCPSDISNLKVMKKAAERNGYFIVGTEYGDCAISAKRMNEVTEAVANESTTAATSNSYKIHDIDVYAEALYKYE